MIEPNNGNPPTTSADKYTGAIILRTRPHTYKRVVRLLSEGVPAIRIAEIGGANVERKIGKASVRDAIIGTGVAIDKMLALTGEMPVGIQIANIQMPTPEQDEARRRAHHALDEITRLLHKPEPWSP